MQKNLIIQEYLEFNNFTTDANICDFVKSGYSRWNNKET